MNLNPEQYLCTIKSILLLDPKCQPFNVFAKVLLPLNGCHIKQNISFSIQLLIYCHKVAVEFMTRSQKFVSISWGLPFPLEGEPRT